MLLHRGERGDRLPDGAGRVRDLGDTIEAGEVGCLGRVVVHEGGKLVGVDPPDVDGRLVRRERRHRPHRTVPRIEGDDRPARDVVLLVGPRKRNPLAERSLRRALHVDVDRQSHGRSRLGVATQLDRALLSTPGVDADLRSSRDAAEVFVELRLDAGLPDLVAAAIVLSPCLLALQLLGRHLTDVPEELRAE